jgi:hypothetical protein
MQKEDQNQFQDQFDQYLYQSRHITTPVSRDKDDHEIIEGKGKMSNKVTVCVRLFLSPDKRSGLPTARRDCFRTQMIIFYEDGILHFLLL